MNLKNERGQILVEQMLLTIMGVSLLIFALGKFREDQMVAKLVGGPWVKLSGMIESGVLADPATAKGRHANQFDRKASYDPNE